MSNGPWTGWPTALTAGARRAARPISAERLDALAATPYRIDDAQRASASKAALRQLNDSVQVEVAGCGIDVTDIEPGGSAPGYGPGPGRSCGPAGPIPPGRTSMTASFSISSLVVP